MPINIGDTAENLNITRGPELFAEVWPLEENALVVRFAKVSEQTKIHVKQIGDDMITGGIIMWHGLIADIPPEYALCDGNNGTPDLRDRFVVGAPDGDDPGGIGGNINHNHTFTGDGHQHEIGGGTYIQPGSGYHKLTIANNAVGTTDNEDGRPPFYEIAFIMKL